MVYAIIVCDWFAGRLIASVRLLYFTVIIYITIELNKRRAPRLSAEVETVSLLLYSFGVDSVLSSVGVQLLLSLFSLLVAYVAH